MSIARSRAPDQTAHVRRSRCLLLALEGLAQGLALIAVARARPPLYGVLVALLAWAALGGEPFRALRAWYARARRGAQRQP